MELEKWFDLEQVLRIANKQRSLGKAKTSTVKTYRKITILG
jgi:hypothetical protein